VVVETRVRTMMSFCYHPSPRPRKRYDPPMTGTNDVIE
jgi:hypothetical protein